MPSDRPRPRHRRKCRESAARPGADPQIGPAYACRRRKLAARLAGVCTAARRGSADRSQTFSSTGSQRPAPLSRGRLTLSSAANLFSRAPLGPTVAESGPPPPATSERPSAPARSAADRSRTPRCAGPRASRAPCGSRQSGVCLRSGARNEPPRCATRLHSRAMQPRARRVSRSSFTYGRQRSPPVLRPSGCGAPATFCDGGPQAIDSAGRGRQSHE
jgi:hypothetical protein